MTLSLLQEPVMSFEDGSGRPLSGGKLHTYAAGTLTLKATFQDQAGNIPNTNPITLNARGEATVYGSGNYRMILRDSKGNTIWDRDNINVTDLSQSGGSSAIGFIQAGSNAVARTAQDKMRDTVSVLDYGADRTGATSAVVAIQNAINALAGGTVVIPPGRYLVDGEIRLTLKANGAGVGPKGGFRIEATGAQFIGTGRILVDSCKRVQINGLDAPDHDLVWRGQWWGKYSNMRFRNLIMADALGTDFNSNYWTKFDTCVLQKVVFETAAITASNAITFVGCSFRGRADQGFSQTADYALEFLANQNCQDWHFIDCDLSYYNVAIYRIGAGNTTGQIELHFDDCYFDTLSPKPLSRSNSRIVTNRSRTSNELQHAGTLSAIARGAQDSYRQDRAAAWRSFTAVNLVPNGDFRVGLPSYTGAGLPLGSVGGATVTEMSGAGLFGRYLNINQPNATNNAVRFRPRPAPFAGRYTAVVLVRNASGGTKTIQGGFNALFNQFEITNTEWTLWTLTSGTDIAAGAVTDILLSTADGTPFNIDVCYAAVTFGEGGVPFVLASPHQEVEGSMTFNPPSIINAGQTTQDVTVPGAALGDYAIASFSIDTQGIKLDAQVRAANVVRVTFTNNTGAPIDLGGGTLRVLVRKWSYG